MRRRSASKGAGGALLAAVVVGAVSLSGTAAVAQDKKPMIPGTFSGNVALTSEYLYRGISQTDDQPAIQGGFNYELEIAKPVSVYAGVWGSNVDFSAFESDATHGASIEMDWVGGFRGTFGSSGVTWDVGFIYYSYPGADSSYNYNFWEAQTAIGYDFGVASVTGSVNYSPDFFGSSGTAWYPKLAVSVPIPSVDGLSLSAYVAKQYVQDEATYGIDKDYVEWNLTVSYNVLDWFDASIAYEDTNLDPGTNNDGQTAAVLFTISRSF